MKFRTLFCLFAMLALAPVVFAQERAPGRDPSPPQNGSERQLPGSDIEVKTSTHEDVKTTESQIKDLKKRLEKLEKEFNKKQKELNDKIANEKDEKKLAKLKAELEKLEKKFKDEKEKTEGTLARLERFPIESQTRDAKSALLLPGNCGNAFAWQPMDPRRELVENLGATNVSYCHEYPSRQVSLFITNGSPLLLRSACYHTMDDKGRAGEYTFHAPGLTIIQFCNVQGANCKVFVFIERMPIFNMLALSPDRRDESLVSICPKSGQVEYPAYEAWELLNMEADLGTTDYDSIIRGIAQSIGGVSSTRFGLGGLQTQVEAGKRYDKLALRNIVLDNKLSDLMKNIQPPWLEIDKEFTPFLLPATQELSFINRVGGRINIILNKGMGPDSLESVRTLISDVEKSEHKPKDYPLYQKSLEDVEKLLQEGKTKEAKKSLNNFATKVLEKEAKTIIKEHGKSLAAREKVSDILDQWEFLAATSAIADFVKTHPDKEKRKQLSVQVEAYKTAAKPLQERVEKLKAKLSLELKEGELLEPIVVKPGEKVVFLVSIVGADYDFERQKTKLRALIDEKFAPADEQGAVPKGGQTYDNTIAGIISFDELISKGFTMATVETKNGQSIISAVKKGGSVLSLRSFADREGVTTEEVALKDLKERSGLAWIPITFPASMSQSAIPKDPNTFLTTTNFLDRDSNQVTVLRFVFESERVLHLRAKDTDERIDLHYFLYPGGYENLLTLIDALKQDAKKREFKLPAIHFKVLPPDSNDKPDSSDKKE